MAFSDSKPHYALLDGLRGVAAMLVVWYHVFEGFQFAGNKPVIDFINHGYLAVDFFFMLSGFVIGYAYDDRWGKSLTMSGFFRRSSDTSSPYGDAWSADRHRIIPAHRYGAMGRHPLNPATHTDSPRMFVAHDSGIAWNATRRAWQW